MDFLINYSVCMFALFKKIRGALFNFRMFNQEENMITDKTLTIIYKLNLGIHVA